MIVPAGRRPLEGRTVLITRPAGEGRTIAARIETLGGRAVEAPAIAFEACWGSEEARAAIRGVGAYDLLVFTSANGVRFFLDALRSAGLGPGAVHGATAAVGPGTARALEASGLAPSVVASDSRAEGLAAALGGRVPTGARVLWIRPESARDVLPEALETSGATVDGVAFYRTVPAPEAAEAAARTLRGEFDAAIFASPSSVRGLLDALPERRREVAGALLRLRRVAIGRLTAAALAEAGIPATAIAEVPSDAGVEAALVRAFAP